MKRFLLFFFMFFSGFVLLSAQQPWAGGLNACQFGRMDLDGDGKRDLLVFDRQGDRLLCFLNQGGVGTIDYRYTKAYNDCFPALDSWVIFADYDGDGQEDIYTYSKGWAGIRVYKNCSSDSIAFQLVVDPYLSSWQGGGEVNILATEADYPAIVDVDGDGDLDLLTFGVMGTFIEKHLNRSMERFGCLDSLVYERTDPCWGRVGESEENNLMYLDTCLFGYGIVVPASELRHRGATVTLRDLTGDGLLDLILADVDYPGLTLLINGGDSETAVMVSQTMDFPQETPVRLFSMPVPFFTDIDNDGVDDLLVSPFDPDPMASEGLHSVWLYLNRGTNEHPSFQLFSKSFLQDAMIDVGTGAYPTVVDWDGDGLLDLVVGSIGNIDSTWYHYGNLETHRQAQLTWLRNVGTTHTPSFSMGAFPFSAGDVMGLVPSFADLDGDGKPELLVGTAEGRMMLFDDDGVLLDADFLSYDKSWSAPCFFDVDRDGALDLVVGNATGKLTFFKKTEDGRQKIEGSFERVSDFWGGVDVRDYGTSYYGFSVPSLFYWEHQTVLCVGSESGRLFLFEGVTADAETVFDEVSWRWTEICSDFPASFGMRSSAVVADLNGDGRVEVVVGNFSGGLQLFNADIPVHDIGVAEQQEDAEVVIFPNPVQSQLTIVTKKDSLRSVTIRDINGRTCLKRKEEGRSCVLELGSLNPGIYLLELNLDRGGVSRIFLKR